jgi:uncharacterized protein (DUF1800 family)
MGRGLAERRKEMDDAKARARQIVKARRFRGDVSPPDPVAVGITAVTPHPCSCRGCANERRVEKGHKRLTMQERKTRDARDEVAALDAEAWQCKTCTAPAEPDKKYCRYCESYWNDVSEFSNSY